MERSLAAIAEHTDAKVYHLVDGAFARVAELSAEGDDTLTTPLLPQFAAPLREIFRQPI